MKPNWPNPITINEPQWPLWVHDLVGPCPATRRQAVSLPLQLATTHNDHFTMVEARVADAGKLDPQALERRTRDAYMAIAGVLTATPARHLVRIWNYLPGIHTPSGPNLDRYMVFNAGRYAAFCDWLGDAASFATHLPTATAIGHRGNDLVILALACTEPGIPVENPRQTPAYRYSPRYGPKPPCFARATVLRPTPCAAPLILVGGTSSVFGEDSVHVGDLRRQTQETLENLGTLVRSACIATGTAEEDAPVNCRPWLQHYRELRVYCPKVEDMEPVVAVLRESFDHLTRVELFQADLCRAELPVEISGLAVVEGPANAGAAG